MKDTSDGAARARRMPAHATVDALGTKLLHFTLLYFTCTLSALLQILAVTFDVTSGKVPNVTRSHDRVTRLLEIQVVVRLPLYRSHSARSP